MGMQEENLISKADTHEIHRLKLTISQLREENAQLSEQITEDNLASDFAELQQQCLIAHKAQEALEEQLNESRNLLEQSRLEKQDLQDQIELLKVQGGYAVVEGSDNLNEVIEE